MLPFKLQLLDDLKPHANVPVSELVQSSLGF